MYANVHHTLWLLILSLFLPLAIAPTAMADRNLFSSSRYPVTLVTGNRYYPFADHSLPQGGMSTEIVKAAFEASGFEARVLFMPWRRGFIGVQRHLYEGTFPHFYTEELARDYLYSESIYPGQQRIYVSNNSGVKFNRISDLVGLRFCSPIGHAIDGSLQKLIDTAAISIISPSAPELCAKMLERHRVDFMALDETVYNHMFRDLNLKAVGEPLANADLYLLLPLYDPNSEMLMKAFNSGLKCIKASGIFDDIVRRHLSRRSFCCGH